MLQPGDDAHQHLAAAQEAAGRGDLIAARHHLNVARQEGLSPDVVAAQMQAIDQTERLGHLDREHRLILGIALPIAGYAILSALQPTSWTTPVWIALGFVLIPVCAGLMTARTYQGFPRGAVLLKAFGLCSATMFAYTFINLAVLNGRIANQQLSEVAGAVIVVALAYAVAAGAVGALSAMLAYRGAAA